MKFLTLILSLSMTMTSHASLGTSSGHGAPSDVCAYNQSPDRLYEAPSVTRAKAALKGAQNKLDRLKEKESKYKCEPCLAVFSKYLEYYPKEVDNYDAYIAHLEGGGACSAYSSNTDFYNHWAFINKWESIDESKYSTKAIRNIAGGEIVEGGGSETPIVEVPEAELPGPSDSCPYFVGPGNSLKPEFCGNLRRHIKGKYSECTSCLSPSKRYPNSKLGECLKAKADLGASITLLEKEISELEDELLDAENSGEAEVCINCPKQSKWKKWGPTILGVAGGVGLGYLVKKSEEKSFNRQQAEHRLIQEDNNRKGFPSPYNAPRDNSSRNGLIAGALGGVGVYSLAKSSGHFGCSSSSSFGNGIITSGGAQGQQAGGATGLSGILAGLLGGGNGLGTSGVVGGQGAVPPGYAVGPNGQLVYVGSGGLNGVGGPSLSSAQLQAEINAANQRAAQLGQYQAWQNSRDSIISAREAELRAIGQNPLIGQNLTSSGSFINSSGQVINGGGSSGVLAPSGLPFLQGGVDLRIGVGGNVGTSQVPFQTSSVDPRFFNNGQILNNGTFNSGTLNNNQLNGVPLAPGNVLPPTTTQPTGGSRLNNF